MKKVIVTGANGQLGSDIVMSLREAGFEVSPRDHADLDIGNFDEVRKQIEFYEPDILINTAAFHHVDQCETNIRKAELINAEAPTYMAEVCRETGTRFIHFSTDYVFNGEKRTPYKETDAPAPLNVYGRTKMLGEQGITNDSFDHLILRVSALYGQNPCRAKNGLNFVQLMLKLAREKGEVTVVNDEHVSPTYTHNIADYLPLLINNHVTGMVHLTSEGECTWYEFAEEIFRYTQTEVLLHKSSSAGSPDKVPRPAYSVLENKVIKKLGLRNMPHWKEALHAYLDVMGLQAGSK